MANGKNLLASAGILLLGAVVVTGATYALFTDKSTVNNHLQAGNLTVGLYRTACRACTVNAKGLLEETPTDTTRVDLAKNEAKVFAVSEAVPYSWYEATVEVKNEGSLAFEYGMRILWNEEGDATKEEKAFAEQMEITVTYGNAETQTFMLSESKDKDIDIGKVLKTETDSFTVRATFIEGKNNDVVQNVGVEFDLQVYATQSTGK